MKAILQIITERTVHLQNILSMAKETLNCVVKRSLNIVEVIERVIGIRGYYFLLMT